MILNGLPMAAEGVRGTERAERIENALPQRKAAGGAKCFPHWKRCLRN